VGGEEEKELALSAVRGPLGIASGSDIVDRRLGDWMREVGEGAFGVAVTVTFRAGDRRSLSYGAQETRAMLQPLTPQ